MAIRGVSSGLSAITRQREAMDRAAEKIARATLATTASHATAEASADSVSPLLEGTVELMVAQRMFTAAVKMAQTANEGVVEALRAGKYSVSS